MVYIIIMGGLCESQISQLRSCTARDNGELDLTQVFPLPISTVDVIGVEYSSTDVSFILRGFHMQVAWLILSSPWKPLVISSNNTLEPFFELSYNPILPENPIANTTHKFAWDYDANNDVIFIKLLLTSEGDQAIVRVTLYYIVSVEILEFKPSKYNYSITEPVDVYATLFANYTFEQTFQWILRILVYQSSTGKLFQEGAEEFDLQSNETKTVHYQFKPITEAGNYTAIARVHDAANNNVVESALITFMISEPEKPPGGEFVIPDWVKYLLLIFALFGAGIMVYRRYKTNILRFIRRKPKP